MPSAIAHTQDLLTGESSFNALRAPLSLKLRSERMNGQCIATQHCHGEPSRRMQELLLQIYLHS